MLFSNKYEEALARCVSDFEDRVKTDTVLMVGRMDLEALEELVNLATPVKKGLEAEVSLYKLRIKELEARVALLEELLSNMVKEEGVQE